MDKKKIVVFLIMSTVFCIGSIYLAKNFTQNNSDKQKNNTQINSAYNSSQIQTNTKPIKKVIKPKVTKKIITTDNLYNDNNILPLYAISEISTLPLIVKSVIYELSETSYIYFVKVEKNYTKLIVEDIEPDPYARHNIDFLTIDNNTGEISYAPFGRILSNSQNKNEKWKINRRTRFPISHTKYNSEKEIEYTEFWNYSDENEIKYELKSGNGNILSVKREIPNEDFGIRIEHIDYDKEGNTLKSIIINYSGANITRFTYYNKDSLENSFTITSEYNDGLKLKEQLYSSEYKLLNTLTAEYKDCERTQINISNSIGETITEIKLHTEE